MTPDNTSKITGTLLDDATENSLRLKQLQLRGILLAGFTHEIRSQLAIIAESTGLIEDYLLMGEIKDELVGKKIAAICSNIGERLQSSAALSQHLNSFSHRTDSESATISVEEFIDELHAFLVRHAHNKGVKLTTSLPDRPISLITDPALLQFMVCRIFFVLLHHICAVEDQTIEISCTQQASTTIIRVSQKYGCGEEGRYITAIKLDEEEKLALNKLHAELKYQPDSDGKAAFELSLESTMVE